VKHSTHNPEIEGSDPAIAISGLYYQHVTIINDDSSVGNKWSFKLIDDTRVVMYDHHKFIIQATGDRKWREDVKIGANIDVGIQLV